MLSPEKLKELPQSFVDTMQALEEYVIKDIARRIKKQGELTDTAKHQIIRQSAVDLDIEKLEREISAVTGAEIKDIDREIRDCIEQSISTDIKNAEKAGIVTTPLEKNEVLQGIINAGLVQTKGELVNITGTMGFRGIGGQVLPITEFYQSTIDFVGMLTMTGGMDYISATRLATKNMAENGLEYVTMQADTETGLM